MCAASASIPHFVPIISKGMGPNTAIHISIRATEATTSENGGLGEQEGERGGRGRRCRAEGEGRNKT